MAANTMVANAILSNRAAIIRTEESSVSWLSDDYYGELSLDAGLLVFCLVAFLVTRSSLAHKGNKQGTQEKSSAPKQEPAVPNAPSSSSPEQLLSLLMQSNDRPRGNILDVYRQCRAQVNWATMSKDDSQRIFSNVSMAAVVFQIRMGRGRVLEGVFSDMDQLGISRSPELYTTLLKMYSAKRLFQDILALWTRIHTDKVQNLDRTAWSCLLWAAAELSATEEAVFFFSQLEATGGATEKDYGNMIRHHASRQDGPQALACLEAMQAQELEPDSFTYNAVFTACVGGSTGRLSVAEKLFRKMQSVGTCVDAITYNTLLKAYVKAKPLDDAFALVTEMESADLLPTSVTFGILLDACINQGCMDRAHDVFCKMQDSNCEMNKVLYTTMIKGFVKMQKVDKVLHILQEMRNRGVEADSVTYSLVLTALCAAGQMESALDLFNSICSEGHRPDEILFNNLLSGCVACRNTSLGEKLLEDMVKNKITPSCATFSTMVKLYAECNELVKAQTFLAQIQSRFGVVPEPRLHWQLLHACLRARQRQGVQEVFEMLIKRHGAADSQEISKALKSCTHFNMLDLAVQLITMSFASGGFVQCNDLQAVVDSALKKRKLGVADSIVELASKRGLHLKK